MHEITKGLENPRKGARIFHCPQKNSDTEETVQVCCIMLKIQAMSRRAHVGGTGKTACLEQVRDRDCTPKWQSSRHLPSWFGPGFTLGLCIKMYVCELSMHSMATHWPGNYVATSACMCIRARKMMSDWRKREAFPY